MRLREIQQLLALHIKDLAREPVPAPLPDRTNGLLFKDMHAYRRAVDAIAEVPALQETAQHVLRQPLMRDAREQILTAPDLGQQLLAAAVALQTRAHVLLDLLNATVPKALETDVSVLLPDTKSLSELQELVVLLKDYASLFDGLPVGQDDERVEPIEFSGFDLGSSWVVLSALKISVVKLIGLAWRYSQLLLVERRRELATARLLEAVASDSEDVAHHNKIARRALRRLCAEKMRDSAAKKANNEDINRMAVIVSKGENLLTRRMQMVPSLTAPQETKDAFPPPELPAKSDLEKLLPEATDLAIKLLTSGEEDS